MVDWPPRAGLTKYRYLQTGQLPREAGDGMDHEKEEERVTNGPGLSPRDDVTRVDRQSAARVDSHSPAE